MQAHPQRHLTAILLLSSLSGRAAADAMDEPIDEPQDEIVVTADLRGRTVVELPASVTVLDGPEIDALSIQHFEELTAAIPNMNWSGEGNRGRYLQIRGVGELEQYEGAPNPSVGFLVDDIDFSGIGTIGTLFDMEMVEVLRGPQGTRYGANALAGLVYLRSTAPTAERHGRVELSAGADDMYSAGLAFGGALGASERALYRLSLHHYASDGFRDNPYLGRDDTNGRSETTLRARIALEPSTDFDVDVALMYVDIDDGYDAFALDNSYTVLSDKPGRDVQTSAGASVRLDWRFMEGVTLTSLSSVADSGIEFGFDADWGNDESWAPVLYDYVSDSDRDRRTASQEFRLASDGDRVSDWLVGVYALRVDEDLASVNSGTYVEPASGYADAVDDRLQSDYGATSVALFGQVGTGLGAASRLSAGLRIERRDADYDDSAGLRESVSETMTGGEVSFTHEFSAAVTAYLSLSRGYKAGGFNLGFVPEGRRVYAREVLWNAEGGVRTRWLDGALALDLTLFRNRREDQQVRTSFQLDPGDPASFVFFTDNAARGTTNGLEADLRWLAGVAWELYLRIGLLDAAFDDFVTPQLDLSGREQAHAPHYSFATGASYRHPSGWFARLDLSGKDAFYFDVSHDQRSDPYLLVNGRVGWAGERWRVEVWGRNLSDTYYAVRGFYFGNEPPDFADALYTRAGDPRHIGLTIERSF